MLATMAVQQKSQVVRFRSRAEEPLCLPDNGLVAVEVVERHVSDFADTAIQKLFAISDQGGEPAARAKAFLKIGAALNSWQEPERFQTELLRLMFEVLPADQGAIVLLPQSGGGAPAITG
jgi:hypothetical protein